MGRLSFRKWVQVAKPLEVKGKNFEKAKFPEVDWRRFT